MTATLPKEMAERFQVRPGDRMFAVETENGILLTLYDPDFHDAVSEARGRSDESVREMYEPGAAPAR